MDEEIENFYWVVPQIISLEKIVILWFLDLKWYDHSCIMEKKLFFMKKTYNSFVSNFKNKE